MIHQIFLIKCVINEKNLKIIRLFRMRGKRKQANVRFCHRTRKTSCFGCSNLCLLFTSQKRFGEEFYMWTNMDVAMKITNVFAKQEVQLKPQSCFRCADHGVPVPNHSTSKTNCTIYLSIIKSHWNKLQKLLNQKSNYTKIQSYKYPI